MFGGGYMNEKDRIGTLKGIGSKTEALFQKLGIFTVSDLLHYYPKGYDVYEMPIPIDALEEGYVQTIRGQIVGRVQVAGGPRKKVISLHVADKSGQIRVCWFNMPFLKNTLKGGEIILRGRMVNRRNELVMEHPEIFYPPTQYDNKLNTLQPTYPLTSGIGNKVIGRAIRQIFEQIDVFADPMPEDLRMKYGFVSYDYALRNIHFPEEKKTFYHARERLVCEEFLHFILELRVLKEENTRTENSYVMKESPEVIKFAAGLPYKLTAAQKKVWNEIVCDMESKHSMSRLIQGDVGSGKTIVAVLALLSAVLGGYQGALMVPTEVLAKQHAISIGKLLKEQGIHTNIELVTGSMTVKEKREAYERISSGEANIIIGTHALIQEKINYHNLALVVTDEQHRFGVKQREILAKKGKNPHILVMSATPIPRTLAIILYGDLDLSVIDELPANRLPIKNCVVGTDYRRTAYNFIEQQVIEGRQCYIICPMVEESEHLEIENVVDYTKIVKDSLSGNIQIEYLHGKMKQAEKDGIMERFFRNEIQVLVSTTVIEVGIDAPNATVMMVENAERFGLAQLHQLRGRVGRGKHQSFCIFVSSSKSKETRKRLEILNKSNDGFYIASEDLKLRGPGDLFGIRQSGLMDFRLGDVFQDATLLQKANEMADSEDMTQYIEKARVRMEINPIL